MTQENRSLQPAANSPGERNTFQAILRGLRHRCPSCGEGRLYASYLKVADSCPHCGEELHHHRADDAPPYFVMLIVGHILVGAVLSIEQLVAPPTWVYAVTFGPLTLLLVLILLPRIKGALVALQWAMRMHGFDPDTSEIADGGLSPASPPELNA